MTLKNKITKRKNTIKNKAAAAVLSHVQLCSAMDCSLPGSSDHGTFQRRTLEQVAISYTRGFSTQGSNPDLLSLMLPALTDGFLTTSTTWEACNMGQPHGLYSPWNSPSQNTAVDSLSLLQGIFPTQVSCIAGGFFTS